MNKFDLRTGSEDVGRSQQFLIILTDFGRSPKIFEDMWRIFHFILVVIFSCERYTFYRYTDTIRYRREFFSEKKKTSKHLTIFFPETVNTVNFLYSGHCRDLKLVSSVARVRNSGSLFQSNVCNFFARNLSAVRIIGESVIAGCPQGESWLYSKIGQFKSKH